MLLLIYQGILDGKQLHNLIKKCILFIIQGVNSLFVTMVLSFIICLNTPDKTWSKFPYEFKFEFFITILRSIL